MPRSIDAIQSNRGINPLLHLISSPLNQGDPETWQWRDPPPPKLRRGKHDTLEAVNR